MRERWADLHQPLLEKLVVFKLQTQHPRTPKLLKEIEKQQQPEGVSGPASAELPVGVRARLAVLGQQWPVAESLLLAQGRVDDAIGIYKDAHRSVGWLVGWFKLCCSCADRNVAPLAHQQNDTQSKPGGTTPSAWPTQATTRPPSSCAPPT